MNRQPEGARLPSRRLRRAAKRGAVIILGSALLAGLLLEQDVGPVRAQDPTPAYYFANVTPGVTTVPAGAWGIVLEGLGGGAYVNSPPSCAYSQSLIEQWTVYWINQGRYTWTEISPQSQTCGVVNLYTAYQSEIQNITNYVESNAPNAGTYWLGIMVDEEAPEFGFGVGALEHINNSIANTMLATPGISWWATENFSGQDTWSQDDFDNITRGIFNGSSAGSSRPADQVATGYMVQLINHYQQQYSASVLVTWSTTAQTYLPPYNNRTNADNAISGAPYSLSLGSGKASHTYYLDNQFCPGSCS